jgi:DNA-binding MarR family transcriptional regulator
MPRPDLPTATRDTARALNAIRRLVRGLRVYTRECEAQLGLSAAQLYALSHVDGRAGLSLQELASATMTDLSSVSVVAKRLVAKGLLTQQRSAADKRRAELRLSPAGTALLKLSPVALQDRLAGALAAMPGARRKQLADGLEALLRGAGLDAAPADMFFEDRS